MYRVLGEVAVDGASLTRRRERELLCMLIAARGVPVAVERILEELCDDGGGRAAVQVAVSRLRSLLDPARTGPRVIETTPAGYRLDAVTASVDAWAFEDLAEQSLSAASGVDRLVLGTRAVDLWTGSPYAECRAPSLVAEAARLEELHVTVQESRAEALLSLGHPAAAVRLLAALAPQHPYREQLWVLLARAQYAAARQADALATLATVRARLAEDLGVDPAPVVREVERAILVQDPALTPVPVRTRRTHGVQTRVTTRCRAVSAGYVLGHTPSAGAATAGTMTG